jgi:UDP-glucose 4-epimerase
MVPVAMRTLVTGGGGFIGSHVVDRLKAAGHDVFVVDLRPPHRPDVGHIAADINDLDALVAAFAGADTVFHLAAYADVNDVSRDPVDATDANVVGVAKVWEACRRNQVRRAVLASTVWVYNGAAVDGDGPLDENAAFRLDDLGHQYTSSTSGPRTAPMSATSPPTSMTSTLSSRGSPAPTSSSTSPRTPTSTT